MPRNLRPCSYGISLFGTQFDADIDGMQFFFLTLMSLSFVSSFGGVLMVLSFSFSFEFQNCLKSSLGKGEFCWRGGGVDSLKWMLLVPQKTRFKVGQSRSLGDEVV